MRGIFLMSSSILLIVLISTAAIASGGISANAAKKTINSLTNSMKTEPANNMTNQSGNNNNVIITNNIGDYENNNAKGTDRFLENFIINGTTANTNTTLNHNAASSKYQIASGDITDKSAIVWSRAEKPGIMTVQFSTDSSYSNSALKSTIVNASTDFTGHIKLDMLSPNSTYYYKVWFARNDTSKKPIPSLASTGTFKTAPSQSDSKSLSFVVGGDLGGQQYCRRLDTNYPIFKAMEQYHQTFSFSMAMKYTQTTLVRPPVQ